MITVHKLGTEEVRGQGIGWVPAKCQHAAPGEGSACHFQATNRATTQVAGVWFQSYVCDHHATRLQAVRDDA